ncbi:MAG: hypothetical protein ABI164_06550 [Acidobacteriaceae bacterium]
MTKSKIVIISLLGLAAVGAAGAVLRMVRHYRVATLVFSQQSSLPVPVIENSVVELTMPNGNLVGMVGEYSDELTAYLRLQYLRSLKPLSGKEMLIRVLNPGNTPVYRLYIIVPNSILQSTNQLARLQAEGYIERCVLKSPPTSELRDWNQQTRLFEAAYEQPVHELLLQLPRSQLTSSVARFILFKIRTDDRARQQLIPADKVLSHEESLQFAADMIDVAKFYDIPLSMLLGIGAMENNFIDIRGDLKHAVWKRHAQPGDIVLKRRRGRVFVSNYSQGPWQITRETLRYVHSLFLKDNRDYSQLPQRLRPPKKLDLDNVSVHVLTTYAGLLLRKLLDDFHGDEEKAIGAYNGGYGKPNMKYAEGASLVATYARRVLTLAAQQKGMTVQETPLKVAQVGN